jgi:hypothetical protein
MVFADRHLLDILDITRRVRHVRVSAELANGGHVGCVHLAEGALQVGPVGHLAQPVMFLAVTSSEPPQSNMRGSACPTPFVLSASLLLVPCRSSCTSTPRSMGAVEHGS